MDQSRDDIDRSESVADQEAFKKVREEFEKYAEMVREQRTVREGSIQSEF